VLAAARHIAGMDHGFSLLVHKGKSEKPPVNHEIISISFFSTHETLPPIAVSLYVDV
jgi:hypothetical protein